MPSVVSPTLYLPPNALGHHFKHRLHRIWNYFIYGSSSPSLPCASHLGPIDGAASASIACVRTGSPAPSSTSSSASTFYSCFGPCDGDEQEVKILEDNLDQSILREEENLTIDGAGETDSDVQSLKQSLKAQRLKADVEVEALRKKLSDVEMKNARTIHDLNKEISELEALVEAKIYREDELEQDIERLKEKVAKLERKRSKTSIGPETVASAIEPSPNRSSTGSFAPSHTSNLSTSSVTVCEICDKPGHDIFTCDMLKEDGPLSAKSITSAAHKAINGTREDEEELDIWCEECEGHGHTAENCPDAEDVF